MSENEDKVFRDVFKLLTHLIERIFEEQRITREVLTRITEVRKSGATDRLDEATGERYQLWEAIRQLEQGVSSVVISQATQNSKIDEIRDWLMPRRVRFRKWWNIWKDSL